MQPIVGLIPTFWEDIKCQSYKKEECQNDLSGFTNESNFISKDKSECSSNVEGQCMERVNYLTNITAKSTTHFIRSCFDNNLDIESKSAFTTQFSQDSREKIGNEKNLKSKISCERKFQAHLQSPIDGRCNYEKDGTADINTFCDYFLASKVKFFGSGIHNDGAYFDIKYLVKKVILNNEVNYCIRVSLNFPKYIQSKNKLNNSDTPSLNSISLSSFITKDVSYLKINIRFFLQKFFFKFTEVLF